MAKKTLTQQTQTLDGHSGLGDKPNINDGLSAAQLKTRYDRDVNRNKDYLNSTLIAELQESTTDDSGAHAIGFDGGGYGDNVADALDTIISAGSGSIPPDNTISTAKLQDGAVTNDKLASDVKVGSLASLTTTEKGSVVGAINELVSGIPVEQYEEADTPVTNGTTTYSTVVTLTVATTGTYTIHYSMLHGITTSARYSIVRLVHNDTTELSTNNGVGEVTPDNCFAGVKKYSLTASDTLKLEYKMNNTDAGESATAKDARIFIQEYTGS